jgi:hypothetical protein
MGDGIDIAQDAIERAHHHQHAEHGDPLSRNAAILIAGLAACLALAEMGEKSSQNAYLTHHIAASDDWALFQAKSIRATMTLETAEVLEALKLAAPNESIAEVIDQKIAKAKAYAAHLEDDPAAGDGKKQQSEKAKAQEEAREHELHRYHNFEMGAGGLQISIVLASVSVVTRMRALLWGGGLIGLGSALGALAVSMGWI